LISSIEEGMKRIRKIIKEKEMEENEEKLQMKLKN
jgi:hypothetical protein